MKFFKIPGIQQRVTSRIHMTTEMNSNEETKVLRGLEGVVAAETDISFVDGQNGELYYKGYNIHDIAEHARYHSEIIYLLIYGELPEKKQLQAFRRRIISEMQVPTQVIKMIEIMPFSSKPMDVLRTAVSALAWNPFAQVEGLGLDLASQGIPDQQDTRP